MNTPANLNLTGIYSCNDGGTYYIRQVGGTIYWLGMSGDNGKTFTNVYHGFKQDNFILGTWADVPHGTTTNNGTLNLKITSPTSLFRIADSGGFFCSVWQKK